MTVLSVAVERNQILAIVQEVFSAMLDQGQELVEQLPDQLLVFDRAMSAYVDMFASTDLGSLAARALLRTEVGTAHSIARELLMLAPDESVTHEDLVDAFGEIANVVGGNVKALINAPAKLSLPTVLDEDVETAGDVFVQDLNLAWRGQGLSVSLWLLARDQEER